MDCIHVLVGGKMDFIHVLVGGQMDFIHVLVGGPDGLYTCSGRWARWTRSSVVRQFTGRGDRLMFGLFCSCKYELVAFN